MMLSQLFVSLSDAVLGVTETQDSSTNNQAELYPPLRRKYLFNSRNPFDAVTT